MSLASDLEPTGPWYRGLTKAQWTILTIAWLGWVFDIMDTALFNLAKVNMLTDMLGRETYKAIGARIEADIFMVFLIGWSLGGLIFGVLADTWGRTRTLVLTVLLYCFFTGLTALCQTPEQVAVVRFLTALGIGGEWAAGAALVAEAFPDKRRAPAASVLQTAAAIGPMLAALANYGLAGQSWRWLFVIGVLPAFLTIFIRMGVKEPAKSVKAVEQNPTKVAPLKELATHPTYRRHAIVAVLLGVVGIAGAGNVAYWTPNLVKEMSEGLSDAAVSTRTSTATMIMHLGTLAGVFVFPWLCERIGRRRAFGLFFALTPASVALAIFGSVSYERLLIFSPLMTFFSIGLSAGYALYFPELFPARLRGTGSGLAYNTGRILSAPFPKLTQALMSQAGSVHGGVMAASAIYAIGIVALFFAPETKGKPLPD